MDAYEELLKIKDREISELNKTVEELTDKNFDLQMEFWKEKNNYSYREIVKNFKDSLLEISDYHSSSLIIIISEYGLKKVENYFVNEQIKNRAATNE